MNYKRFSYKMMLKMKTKETTFSFQEGKPVTGNRLVGREEIIDQVLHLALSGQSVVLIAPRHFGKTSILLEVINT